MNILSKASLGSLALGASMISVIANASTWRTDEGVYASTFANLTDTKYDRELSIHFMHFYDDNSIIASIMVPQNDMATQQICGRHSQLSANEYKEVNVGLSNVNGQSINMVAVCNGALQSDYNQESKTTNYVYRWNVELQPETQTGMNYITLQLAEGKDLDIAIDIMGSGRFTVANDNFVEAFIPVWEKTKAL
ncbi:hypothetical protein VHA01S_010_00800 [Vibrio halioticoli NBRC 102217]|uniref:Uncharacterized protein n=1 Tax=Vibrio halioticoli NBRC 102217 TaxID=1219072 RepID=V5F173_9VIBR|nr:hypothetical protein [Vibrio halioticoli]GAD88854.1 hypothetical protein VHA01S_010_00800 [Vibrio halioticoli NBRC 102217]